MNTLDGLVKDIVADLETREGVTSVELMEPTPGEYFIGFDLDGVAVSVAVGYTQ